MNEIHMRFVKDGKITGYGLVHDWTGYVSFETRIGFGVDKPSYPCDTIERGIKVRGEVWYEGDRFQGPNGKATLRYFDYLYAWGMLDDGNEVPYVLSWLDLVKWEYKRIGNIHEEVKP